MDSLRAYRKKQRAEASTSKSAVTQIFIDTVYCNGSSIQFGDNHYCWDMSVNSISQQIEEKGGEDAEELKRLLNDVQKLLEYMEENQSLYKDKNIFERIKKYIIKNPEIIAAMIELIGNVVIHVMGG